MTILSFLPWIFDIAFPADDSDPFVAWSPVNDSFVVSQIGEDAKIFTVDDLGRPVATNLTKNERDSLIPQMYFTQLLAKDKLPDTIAGRGIDIPTLKQSQWVFSSLPRDINRINTQVYPIMESRPKRIDLEDPTEVFTLDNEIKFFEMMTNTLNSDRSRRFANVLARKGFTYPAVWANADITARKAYDEGYLLIDSANKLYHMKMQAGQPFLAMINMPDGVTPKYAFILENPDRRQIGLVSTSDASLYAIERADYQPIRLPIENVNPEKQRIAIMKNLFNWVIRISDEASTRWIAIDSDDYSLLGQYCVDKNQSKSKRISRMIFPFRLSFTNINDCFAYPRISDFSIIATTIWLIIIALTIIIIKRTKQ